MTPGSMTILIKTGNNLRKFFLKTRLLKTVEYLPGIPETDFTQFRSDGSLIKEPITLPKRGTPNLVHRGRCNRSGHIHQSITETT